MRLMRTFFSFSIFLCAFLSGVAQTSTNWRIASNAELQALLPARATVQQEHIETEMRSASGVSDGHGKMIAGIVLITAGYSADGKYSHFFVTQVPIHIGDFTLPPGEYVFGWQRGDDLLNVSFYDAATGLQRGVAQAHHIPPPIPIASFRIWPPQGKALIQIGRFGLPYKIER